MSNELLDLRDKISAIHSDMYKGMLRVNELPLILLKRHFAVKSILDRISGRLNAADLLRILMDVGFNPDTGELGKLGGPPESVEITMEEVEEAVTGETGPIITMSDEETEIIDEVAEELAKPTPEREVLPISDTEDTEPEAVEDTDPTYPVDTEVRVFVAGAIQEGKVVEIDGEVYVVETEDGERHEVFEEDIEAN